MAIVVFQFGFFGSKSKSSPSFGHSTQTLLLQSGDFLNPAVSPDGRYVAYVLFGSDGLGLSLLQIATGTSLQIVPPRGGVSYRDLRFAPDNSNFYFVSADESGIGILYHISTLGGPPRKVVEGVEGGLTFSPDGAQIAFVRIKPKQNIATDQTEGDFSIIVINSDGTDERTIASIDAVVSGKKTEPDYWSIDWSPDGSTIAYAVLRHDSEREFSYIAEISPTGGVERRIGKPWPGRIESIRWLNEKNGFAVNAIDGKSKVNQLYYVSYPDGIADPITNDLNYYYGISVTADGKSLVTQHLNPDRQIWAAPDGNPNHIRQLTNGNKLCSDMFAWVRDDHLAYDLNETGSFGNRNIWLMRADGSEQQNLTFGNESNTSPTVSPDGQTVVYVSNRSGVAQLWRMNIDQTGRTQLTTLPYSISYPQFSPDGQTVYFRALVGGENHLWRVSINGGDAAEFSNAAIDWWAVSPDGKRLAYSYNDTQAQKTRVRIRPIIEDKTDKILDIAPDIWMQWAPDGNAIYFNSAKDNLRNLWRQSLDGSPAVPVTDFKTNDRLLRFAWSVNGKQFACVRLKRSVDATLISFDK